MLRPPRRRIAAGKSARCITARLALARLGDSQSKRALSRRSPGLKPPGLLVLCLPLVVLLLTGCLEQVQSPRSSGGALVNFFMHMYAGELDDARAYFAPGLVEMTPQLDRTIKDAADHLRAYEIELTRQITDTNKLREDLGNGEVRQYIRGKVRPRAEPGRPTPTPGEGWQETNILSARMVERGPGWRILDFKVECCE